MSASAEIVFQVTLMWHLLPKNILHTINYAITMGGIKRGRYGACKLCLNVALWGLASQRDFFLNHSLLLMYKVRPTSTSITGFLEESKYKIYVVVKKKKVPCKF